MKKCSQLGLHGILSRVGKQIAPRLHEEKLVDTIYILHMFSDPIGFQLYPQKVVKPPGTQPNHFLRRWNM